MAGFRFLDLPPEIRNRIYFFCESLMASLTVYRRPDRYEDECLVGGGNCVVRGEWFCRYSPISDKSCPGDNIPLPSQPRITNVCRQIREETLPIFYGANGFVIEDWFWYEDEGVQTPFPKILLAWLNPIRHHLHLMKSMAIFCEMDCVKRDHEMIAMLTDQDLAFKEGVLKGYRGVDFSWWGV